MNDERDAKTGRAAACYANVALYSETDACFDFVERCDFTHTQRDSGATLQLDHER